jgi:AraC family transcriptional activator of pobA
MNKIESIEEFYQRKFNWIPDNMHSEIGYFNNFFLKSTTSQVLKKFRNI